MAGTSLDWADKPADLTMSSDEEGLASSHSTASAELEVTTKQNLTMSLGKLRLEQEDLNQTSRQEVTPSTPRTVCHGQTPEREITKPLQLLDLPLDVLKEIIKEVRQTSPANYDEITYGFGLGDAYKRPDLSRSHMLCSSFPGYSTYVLSFRYRLARVAESTNR
jgi:hypothetical protein